MPYGAEELKVNIIGDASSLKGALDKAGSQVDGFAVKIGKIGKTMTIVGGLVTAAFGAIVMKTAAVGDQFDKMSLRTGVAVEELSALAYAADISGTDIGTLEKGLKGLTKTMDDASRGIGEGLEAFEELDIAVIDTEGNLRSTVDVLKEAATKISAIENPTRQAAYAMDLFGAKAGPQLLPLLKIGEGGIDDLMKKAGELGITMSTEAATAAAEFTDRMTDLKGSLAGAGRDIGMILIPSLTKLAEKVIEIIKNVKAWVDAHKPLVEMIIKVTATLGILAAVGGPILLAVSAFIKLKGAMVAVQTFMANPLNAAILLITANIIIWKQVIEEIDEILHSHHTTLKDVEDAYNNLAVAQKYAAEKMDVTVEEFIKMQEEGKTTNEMMGKANEVFTLNAKVTGKMGAGIKAVAKTFKDLGKEIKNAYTILQNEFAPAMQMVEDTIYRLTHTEYETTLKNINIQYETLIEKAKTLGYAEEELANILDKLNEAWKLEIVELDKSNEIKDEIIEKNKEIAESIEPIIEKTKEATEVTKQLGILGGESFEGFTTQIKHATTALSNFTKEGVAAAIAQIKMHFRPIILTLANDINNLTGIWKQMAEANLALIKKSMYEQIDVIKYGLDVYNKAMAQMSGGAGGGMMIPSYQTGIPSVPKTGLAIVHKGERITPASQNTTNNSYTPSIVVNVSGNGNAADIKRAVQEALDESNRQYFRQGKEILLGV